ncbi:MAG: class I SAM-dependent methyltransferase [Planctomycetota bacterium]
MHTESLVSSSQTAATSHPASFRDPSGVVFHVAGELYRQVNLVYRDDYERLESSGLLEQLWSDRLLIPHADAANVAPKDLSAAWRVIKPELVPFISYPYEWSFSQLQDAALLTLEIQRRALLAGLSLKDASAYNVQFVGGRPILIDTLSFERYREGAPWPAYAQFCRHFLAPLMLMALKDIRLGQLLRVHLDGVPLDLASTLLPRRSWWRFSWLAHVHLHALAQRRFASAAASPRTTGGHRHFSRTAMEGLIASLERGVRALKWQPRGTEWCDYYDATNYSDDAARSKGALVEAMLAEFAPRTVWDLGANTGVYSRLAAQRGIQTVAFDIDPAAVEKNYRQVRAQHESMLLPLLLDLTNPSAAQGWGHAERDSLAARGPCDLALALALVHHLAIANNVPLARVAEFFASIARALIIEFVPKEDSQVERLLSSRADVFPDYHAAGFVAAFSRYFRIVRQAPVAGTARTLYAMTALNADAP